MVRWGCGELLEAAWQLPQQLQGPQLPKYCDGGQYDNAYGCHGMVAYCTRAMWPGRP